MRLFHPPHALLHCTHSSSSLPLQSAAYASASTRSLCAPQRAHNAVSFCPVCSPVRSPGLEIQRARASPATPARSRTFSPAHRSPPQCAAPHNLRALRAQPMLSKFSTVHLPPPLASQAKNRCVQRSCLPTAAALPESKKWVCTEVASLLSRATNVPALEQLSASFDCGLLRQPLLASAGASR